MASAPLPATIVAGLRVIYQWATSGLIASGTLSADSAEGIFMIVTAVAAFAYGMWKTHDRQKQLTGEA